MITDNKTYYRLSASLQDPKNPTNVLLENMDGSRVYPEIQKVLGLYLQKQAEQRDYLYIAKTYKPKMEGYKVGRTKDLSRRERELGLQVALAIPCDTWSDFSASNLEYILHKLYGCAELRITGEWFSLTWWDIELIRVTFREQMSIKQKVDCFLAFLDASDDSKYDFSFKDENHTPRKLQYCLRLWEGDSELGTKIYSVYTMRRLSLKGYIPENLYRYAIEELIFLQQNKWHEQHIRPLEKTFEKAVEEYLSLNSTP
jgi:hypothetical protein